MMATKEYVERKFDEFNRQIFAGKLPSLPIELSDAKTFLGVCVCKKRKRSDGSIEKYDFRLRINTRMDLPESEIEDTIIHEMIHYYIGVNQLNDSSAHGPLFLHLMHNINEKYHRHLSVSFKGNAEQNSQFADKRAHWHVVAKVIFADGRTGVKVLPRVLTGILKFYNAAVAEKDIKSVELYMSNNVFFNKYPNSSALRIIYIDEDELNRNLAGAEQMDCDGKRLLRNK